MWVSVQQELFVSGVNWISLTTLVSPHSIVSLQIYMYILYVCMLTRVFCAFPPTFLYLCTLEAQLKKCWQTSCVRELVLRFASPPLLLLDAVVVGEMAETALKFDLIWIRFECNRRWAQSRTGSIALKWRLYCIESSARKSPSCQVAVWTRGYLCIKKSSPQSDGIRLTWNVCESIPPQPPTPPTTTTTTPDHTKPVLLKVREFFALSAVEHV